MTRIPGLAVLEWAAGRGGIVAYHGVRRTSLLSSTHVTPEAFQAHMEFLAGAYDVLPLTEFVARRREGKSLRRCAAVTFDDAYTGVLTYALPALSRLKLPATVFVATSFCRLGKRFWWDRLEYVGERLDAAAKRQLLGSAGLGETAADHEVRDRILTGFRGALPRALDRALRAAERAVGVVPERAMSADELAQLGQSDLIDFGCHSAHHYALPWLPALKVEREIRMDHDWLRERLPRVRPYLAYPYGLHIGATAATARHSGMEAAFSIAGYAAASRFPMYACPRVAMADVSTLTGLRQRLCWATRPVVAARDRRWITERTP